MKNSLLPIERFECEKVKLFASMFCIVSLIVERFSMTHLEVFLHECSCSDGQISRILLLTQLDVMMAFDLFYFYGKFYLNKRRK